MIKKYVLDFLTMAFFVNTSQVEKDTQAGILLFFAVLSS
jgi:hypothetical protein